MFDILETVEEAKNVPVKSDEECGNTARTEETSLKFESNVSEYGRDVPTRLSTHELSGTANSEVTVRGSLAAVLVIGGTLEAAADGEIGHSALTD